MTTHLIYTSEHATAVLTCDHAASSHGLPVLVVGGRAYGPRDLLPVGILAETLIGMWLDGEELPAGAWGPKDRVGARMAAVFLGVTEPTEAEVKALWGGVDELGGGRSDAGGWAGGSTRGRK